MKERHYPEKRKKKDFVEKIIEKPRRALYLGFIFALLFQLGTVLLTYVIVVQFKLYDSTAFRDTMIYVRSEIETAKEWKLQKKAEEERIEKENAPKELETRFDQVMLSKLKDINIFELKRSFEKHHKMSYQPDNNNPSKLKYVYGGSVIGYIITDSTGEYIHSININNINRDNPVCIDVNLGIGVDKNDITNIVDNNSDIYSMSEDGDNIIITTTDYIITYVYTKRGSPEETIITFIR